MTYELREFDGVRPALGLWLHDETEVQTKTLRSRVVAEIAISVLRGVCVGVCLITKYRGTQLRVIQKEKGC